jgi:glycolate oxidase FAD binding subunit
MAPAGPGDVVAGRPARYVARPASTKEAGRLLAAAAGLGLSVVPRGGGTRLDWAAAPSACDLIVDTGRLDQVIEHAAGDLVVTVQAGVQLADLAKVLASAGQRLALDPPGYEESGTVGGLIATGAAGPLRYRYGTPRDLLIGITVVRADGAVTKSGGKVVKNVAGYDLGKLYAGSFGSLGLITEATFRLHPAPAAATWVSGDYPDPKSAAAAVQAIADSPVAPAAIELHWASAADLISVSALLEGDADSVGARSSRLQELLERHAQAGQLEGHAHAGQLPTHTNRVGSSPGPRTPPADGENSADAQTAAQGSDTGGAGDSGVSVAAGSAGGGAAVEPFRVARPLSGDRGAATLIRVSFWAGQLVQVLVAIRAAAARHDLDPAIGGSAAAGVLEVSVDGEDGVASFVTTLRAGVAGLAVRGEHPGLPPANASAVVVRAPADMRAVVDVWGPVPSLELMRAVKDQFDPGHRMAPGRLPGGI